MSANGILQIGIFLLAVWALTKPVGVYLFRVFEADQRPLRSVFEPIERALYAASGVDPREEQDWRAYTLALLVFSGVGASWTYALQRLQDVLPLNPQHLRAIAPDSAFNTAVSFATNTNWQGYAGESTMSHLTQLAGLAWQNFVSAAAGIGVALALARGFTRRPGPDGPATLGNFWVDLIRGLVYVLVPLSVVLALLFVSQGVIQNLAPAVVSRGVEGVAQTLAMGPVASQEAIKQLGTNGGGFFNANSAHPFENPTPITNFFQLLAIFLIPAGLTHTYGRMIGRPREGWAIFGAMAFLFLVGVLVCYAAESRPNPALIGLGVDQSAGNLEGKEVRFGVAASALFATVTTDASCGAVNAMHDSFTPLGGLVPLTNILLGELIFGGVGAGLYAILVYVVLAVFIAGLMVGRTPEYLGKKIEAREMQLAMLYVLTFPLLVLGLAGWSSVADYGTGATNNAGPHGLSEILYAFASAAGNNGSAFAGLAANTPWYNTTLGIAMLAGRFLMIVPLLGIAGSMVRKRVVPAGPGTFPTDGILFAGLLTGVIVIVGALTFFPAVSLGPIVEHFVGATGKVF